jgi:mannose-1-phosphate guanylyltransferase/mannose-6-phosphate isomerase
MVPLASGWNNLGVCEDVLQVAQQDAKCNFIEGDALLADTTNTLFHTSSRLVGTVGVNDLIILETAYAVLIDYHSQSQNVNKLVNQLTKQNRAELTIHRKVYRIWGWYESVDEDRRFKNKRILVKLKTTPSLQMHHNSADHRIVASGTAEVTCGSKVTLLTENKSVYILLGETHRLANPGLIPMEIIEVQSGSYLGEDDIVRFENTYGRAKE